MQSGRMKLLTLRLLGAVPEGSVPVKVGVRNGPLCKRRLSVAAWNLFDDLRLDEAKTHDFVSLRDCFVRELRSGVRCVDADPHVVTSPCDAVIGAFGDLQADRAIQAKGFPYSVGDLLGDERIVDRHRGGEFVTLRLPASMYHRFHAPCDGRVRWVRYTSGDTWNVNPIALKRIENLFCKNERAVLPFNFQPATCI